MKRKEAIQGIRIDWLGQSVIAAQETGIEAELRNLSEPTATEDFPNVFLFQTAQGKSQNLVIQFKVRIINSSEKFANLFLVFTARHFIKGLTHSEETSTFLVQAGASSQPKKFLAAALSQDRLSFLEKELPADAFSKKQSSKLSFLSSIGENRNTRYLSRPIGKSNVLVVQRTDSKAAMKAIKWRIALSIYSGLIILSIALIVSYAASVRFNKGIEHILRETERIANGDLSPIKILPRSEIGILGRAINLMSKRLEELILKQIDAAKKETELLTAKAVEERFFLSENQKITSQLKISGTHRSATECAGDWWCHFNLGNNSELVVIADATGHGAGAALIVGVAYSFFQSYVQAVKMGFEKPCPPEILLERLNRILCETSNGSSTMTMQVWHFEHLDSVARFANAGHNHPLGTFDGSFKGTGGKTTARSSAHFYERNVEVPHRSVGSPSAGGPSKSAGFEVKPIVAPSEMLGMNPEAKFESIEISYSYLRRIFLFTDGLVECLGSDGKPVKTRQILRVLESSAKVPFARSAAEMVSLVNGKFLNMPLTDDITLVQIEVPTFKEKRGSEGDLSAGVDDGQLAQVQGG